jgi:RHS repeat-associated protein
VNYSFLTQKERDIETGLDYFLARYYSSTQGRFTSPDEFTGGADKLFTFSGDASNNPTFYADVRNPQSLNKYQYAYDNPLRFVDPNGHEPEPNPDPEPQDPCGCKDIQKAANQLRSDVEKLDEATSKPLLPITDIIGTSTPPPLGPIALPNDPTRVEPNTQSWPQGWPKAETGPTTQPKAPPPPLMSRRKNAQKVINGLIATAATHVGKINSSDPNDPNRNHWKKEVRAALERAQRLAQRLKGKAQEAVKQKIKDLRGQIE